MNEISKNDASESASTESKLDTVDIQKLLEYLPHRYPFLLVDKIIACVGDESCIGIKNVTVNEPFFQGHFPDHPILPGVLQLEVILDDGRLYQRTIAAPDEGRERAAARLNNTSRLQHLQTQLTAARDRPPVPVPGYSVRPRHGGAP